MQLNSVARSTGSVGRSRDREVEFVGGYIADKRRRGWSQQPRLVVSQMASHCHIADMDNRPC